MFTRQRENQEAIGEMSAAVQSSIAGVRVVRSFALEDDEARRFDGHERRLPRQVARLARLRGLMFPMMQAITALGTRDRALVRRPADADTARSRAGDFLAFFRALSRLTWPLIALGFLSSLIQRGRAAFVRLAEVFDAEPDIVDGPLPAPAQRRRARSRCAGSRSRYGDAPACSTT